MAANPILQAMNPAARLTAPSSAAPAVQLYRMYQAAKNPAAMMQQLAAQNPALAQLQQLRANGTDMEKTFYAMCQQRGVDPQSILAQFQ